MRQVVRRLGLVVVASGVAGAACNTGPAIHPALPGAMSTGEAFEGGVKCSAVRPPTEPDLMGWDPGSRANLAMLRSQGVVAVRYRAEGCNVELEVLSNCIGAGRYNYAPYAATDTKIAHNNQELFAELPIGAARLGGKLRGGRALRTDYTLVGMHALPVTGAYQASDLHGADCERATHVVSRVYLGGFAMVAGARGELEAAASVFSAKAGGAQETSAEHVAREGIADACEKAQTEGKENAQCSVPLRVGLLAIAGRAEGGCPSGSTFDGKRCVQRTAGAEAGEGAGAASRSGDAVVHLPSVTPVRDEREVRLNPRARSVVVQEIQTLERKFEAIRKDSPEHPQVARRLADTYVELESAAQRDRVENVAKAARKKAIDYYLVIVNHHPGYSAIDEVLYDLAYEYEQANDLRNARSVYYDLIKKRPLSRYIPSAYLASGELFFDEAQGEPSKWDLAAQAYSEVTKYPAPQNKVHGYAWYKLGYVFWNKGELEKALNAFKKTIEFGVVHSQLPGASKLAESARREVIPIYALKGDPAQAYDFMQHISGDQPGSSEKTVKMMDDLGMKYMNSGHYPETIIVYGNLTTHDNTRACQYEVRIKYATAALEEQKKGAPVRLPMASDIAREIAACP